MKICPKCQQQYPNGFQYCPNDTELLIVNEEYIRRTVPLTPPPVAEKVEQPAAEVVPIANAPTEELSTPSAPTVTLDQKPREAHGGMPFRRSEPIRTEPIRTGQAEPLRPSQHLPKPEPQPYAQTASGPGGNVVTQAPQPASQPRWESQQISGASASTFELSFSIPEQGGLISRLIAGLKNIGESFKSTPPMRPGAAGDFQFLLKEESLIKRILGELQSAADELRRDPRRFLVEFVRGEGTHRTRRNSLLAGSEMAIVGFFTFYFTSLALGGLSRANSLPVNLLFAAFAAFLVGCYLARGFLLYRLIYRITSKFTVPKVALEFVNWTPLVVVLLLAVLLNNYGFYCRVFPGRCTPPEENLLEQLALLAPTDASKIAVKLDESKAAKEKTIGGSKPKPQKATGGGGGGRQEPTPPSKGVPPQMAMTPQIIPPNPEPPKIKNPSLIVASTIIGDPKALPPMKGPTGDMTGIPAPPSSGPGTGAGIGRGGGTGVGGGEGGGAGAGRGGNTGGGDMGLGGGRSIEPWSASVKPTILYREKAKYTEEARQNKVQGTVVLQVVFHANASIVDIRVIRSLPDGLTEKAIEAAKKIRFNPAVKNGAPVSVRGTLEFSFNLY
jgi:TonB family protein